MKRIISLILLVFILVSCISCSQTQTDDTPSDRNISVSTDGETKNKEGGYDGVFKVGFARIDMTPDESSLGKMPATDSRSDVFNSIKDPLYATCVAVNDGKTTALIITLDTKHAAEEMVTNIKKRINVETSVPGKNVIVSVTHNHSSPDPGQTGNAEVRKWLAKFYNNVGDLAKEAIADLAPAEIYTGTADTTGMAFVRRYLHEDGTYSSIQNITKSTTPIVAHETEADATLQILRFVREGDKKDIVMTNWQAHVAHAIGVYPSSITSDFVYYFRKLAEENNDIHFAYYQGASGNINFSVKVAALNKYAGNYKSIGIDLARKLKAVLDSGKMTKVNPGKVEVASGIVHAEVIQETPERIAHAKEIVAADYDETLIKQYGFATKYDVNATITRSNWDKVRDVSVCAISFGDIAFVAVPYEMFDTNGMEVKDGSPFEMTFVLTCANGHYGYIPSTFAFPHGGYEVNVTKFVRGTGEQFVEKYLSLLNKMKTK